jgi:hypothetical protein
MHVNPSPKFVCMPSNFVAHVNRNKRRACRDMGVGVEVARLVWSGGEGDNWGFHHIFGNPGLPIALPYIYTTY